MRWTIHLRGECWFVLGFIASKYQKIGNVEEYEKTETQLEQLEELVKEGAVDKNSDLYKSHFSFFANWLVKNNNIDVINKENIKRTLCLVYRN